MKKTVSWLLLLVMLFSSQVSFASVEVKLAEMVTAKAIDENSILLNENGKVSKIVQEETPSGLITTVFDSDSGEISKYVRNDDTGTTTVSSSLTEERITLINSTDANTCYSLSEDTMDSSQPLKSVYIPVRHTLENRFGSFLIGP